MDSWRIVTLMREVKWTSSTYLPFIGWLDRNLRKFSGEATIGNRHYLIHTYCLVSRLVIMQAAPKKILNPVRDTLRLKHNSGLTEQT